MYIVQMIDGLVVGGAQELQITFAKEARRRRHRLAVISLSEDDGSKYPSQLQELGVNVLFFPTTRIFDFRNLWRIIQWFRSERPDVLHTHLMYSNIIGSFAGLFSKTPVVSTLHNTGVEEKFRAPRSEYVEVLALRYVISRVIACGPAVSQYGKTFLRNKPILVIPNAIEASSPQITSSEREKIRQEIATDAKRTIIISVGRLVAQKSFEDLIDAFALIHPSHPDLCLAIVGDGHLYDMLDDKIHSLNLAEHVRLLGRRSDVPYLLAVSDMFVLASHWEGLPVAVLEAMAAGLPVLVTDVGDNAWALGSTGVTVPPQQPGILAKAMISLSEDKAHRSSLGERARIRIEEHFNPSIWFDNIINVYQGLLS